MTSTPDPPPPPAAGPGAMLAGMPLAGRLALGVLLIIGAAAELFVTWLLVEHVPWLGWPLTIVSVAAVAYVVYDRWLKPGGRSRGS